MPNRAWQDEDVREPDRRFPSGRWGGYWLQAGRRGTMELDLQFHGGRVFGDGRDKVGDFVVNGSYRPDTGACELHKAYLGQHGVDYDGVGSADGIRGAWSIVEPAGLGITRGAFHIWPLGSGAGDAMTVHAYATSSAH